MRAYLRDTHNITNKYAQNPYSPDSRLSFVWLQDSTQQQLYNDTVLATIASGRVQWLQATSTIVDSLQFRAAQKGGVGQSMTVQNIKANATQLYQMAMKAV